MDGGLFGSTLLDVVIGLFFIYLLLSLVCSAINEMLAGILQLRAKSLESGISNLLQNPELATAVLNHPLIAGISNNQQGSGKKRPSYIPKQLFSQALFDVLAWGLVPATPADKTEEAGASGTPGTTAPSGSLAPIQKTASQLAGNPKTRASGIALLSLIAPAQNDLDAARKNVEAWFDAAMDRLSGAYKRQAQVFLLIIGAAVTVAIGADSYRIAQTLYNDPVTRAAIVAQATQAINSNGQLILPGAGGVTEVIPLTPTNVISATTNLVPVLQELNTDNQLFGYADVTSSTWSWDRILRILGKLPGLLITIIALSLGAPFWFDMLQKLVNLRAAGNPPPTTSGNPPPTKSTT
jgi:hypothetical protein